MEGSRLLCRPPMKKKGLLCKLVFFFPLSFGPQSPRSEPLYSPFTGLARAAQVRNASAYRGAFEARLPDVMESFSEAYRAAGSRIAQARFLDRKSVV